LTCVLHLRLIILLVGGDVPVDSETLLVTDFMNLKIKPAQSFRCAHMGKVCVCVFSLSEVLIKLGCTCVCS
jgi:hypothetical protein